VPIPSSPRVSPRRRLEPTPSHSATRIWRVPIAGTMGYLDSLVPGSNSPSQWLLDTDSLTPEPRGRNLSVATFCYPWAA